VGADYGPVGRLRTIPDRLRAAAYLDLRHDIGSTTLVASTGRSGSTWMAELLNHRNDHRLVFEPFRPERVRKARPIRWGLYVDPEDQDHPLAPLIDELLAGRVRSWWTDRQNHRLVASRRIVKEIRITNLLPWIRRRHPQLPIAYVVRDPVAVARSWLELGWGTDVDDLLRHEELLDRIGAPAEIAAEVAGNGDGFDHVVLRWCLENAIPSQAAAAGAFPRVGYERLQAEPEIELRRLFRALGVADPDGEARAAASAAARPSATAAFPRRARVEPTPEQARRAHELAAHFGIEV
jgi:hypothetical protein